MLAPGPNLTEYENIPTKRERRMSSIFSAALLTQKVQSFNVAFFRMYDYRLEMYWESFVFISHIDQHQQMLEGTPLHSA